MNAPRRARDSQLLDAVEAAPYGPLNRIAWRVVRDLRDPTSCSANGGRWDDGTFDVLYTSTMADGALAEMHFHLGRGQPVFPSRVTYRLFELDVTLDCCVTIADMDALAAFGVRTATFGRLSYEERQAEYPRTQDIGEASHFHGRDGLLVPSARSVNLNLVVLCDRAGPAAVDVVRDHGIIDWSKWRKQPFGH